MNYKDELYRIKRMMENDDGCGRRQEDIDSSNLAIGTLENADRMMNYFEDYKHLLGLDDWEIRLQLDCSPNELFTDNTAGECEWTESSKTAVIRIIDPKDYGERIVPFDQEKTLVHELLHVKLCLLGESGNALQDRLVHQIIDDLAKAIVGARRMGESH